MTGQVIPREIARLQVGAQLPDRVGAQVLSVPVYVDLHVGMIRGELVAFGKPSFDPFGLVVLGFPFSCFISFFEQKVSIMSGQGEAFAGERIR